ncbi:MAG: PAS domain S-box protein, partial [Deltaproteobacteria bacterium]|nr:PAS domain S-box protein [Deltaproteobacteria bacterium]
MRHLATADAKILSILETQQGDLWFGGVQRNIFSYSFEDRSFKRLQASDDIPSRVMKLYQEEGGGIWIGTSLNLCKWDQGMMSSFEPKHVKDILCDRHGVLWFGSRIGLNKLDNGVWTTYTTADGLSDSTVECLAEDHEGTLWLGTDRGLCGLKDGKIFSMGQESGLPLKACRALVYHDHFLYVGMASGLYQIDLDTKHVTAFSEKDGLAGNEVLIRSMAVDHHGHLWIGTTKGLTCYKKDLLKPNMIPPFVKVQRVSTLTADIQETMDIELSHRDNYVRFDFVGLSYSAPEGVRYRYRMNGLSSAWTETEESHVSYAFLPPGTYTFELMACNNDGVWSSSAASFSFSILPPFWKTWWFQSAIGTLFIGFFITAYRVRMVTLYKRNDDLRQMVDERDRMAQALKMSEQNLRITLNSIADAVIATDTQGRITRINPAAERFCGKAESETAGCCLMDVFQLHDEKSGLVSENPVNWILSSGDAIGMAHLNTLVTPDGVTRKVAVSGAPIRTENEQVIGAVLVFRDVTKEYEMREQLTQSCKMDAIGQLAGGVAHDFNNMLGGIMGGAEMLKDYLPANREASALLSIILDSAGRAAELASQLLVFGRKKAHAMVATDVHALIHATAEILRNTLDRRIQLSEDLTQQTPVVLCDAAQVQNVFLNLGINASHAMAHGGKLSFTSRIVELSY